MQEVKKPYVVIGVYGGLAQWDIAFPGTGLPEVDILDFDREEEDDDDRREWLDYALGVVAEMQARLPDVGALDQEGIRRTAEAVEEMAQSVRKLRP